MKGEAPATGTPVRMGLALRARGNSLWKEIRSVVVSGFRRSFFQADNLVSWFELAAFFKQLDSFETF